MNLENIIVYIFCVSAILLQSLSELIWLFTSEIGQLWLTADWRVWAGRLLRSTLPPSPPPGPCHRQPSELRQIDGLDRGRPDYSWHWLQRVVASSKISIIAHHCPLGMSLRFCLCVATILKPNSSFSAIDQRGWLLTSLDAIVYMRI